MKRALTLLLATLAATALVHAQAGRAADEKQIIANERAMNDAFVKADAKAFFALLDRTGVGLDGSGVSRAADLEKILPQAKMTKWNMEDPHIIWVGTDAAVIYYKWTGSGTVSGQAVTSPIYVSTTWRKAGGKWTAVFHQESEPVPPAATAKK